MSHSTLSNWTKKKKIWLGFWLSSPSSHLPPSLPGGVPGWGMCWAVWEKDWNVHIAQMGIEVWTSPWSLLPHLPLLLLQLSFFHPEEPEKRFPIWFRGWVLTSMGDIYISYIVTTAGGGLLPSLPFPKKTFLRIYSGSHLHPSTHTMHPLTHYFKKYIRVPMTCQALGKCWRHRHNRPVGYGSLCPWADTSMHWLWKEKKLREWKWRGISKFYVRISGC